MADLKDVIDILDNSLPPIDQAKQDYLEWIDNSPFLYDFLQVKTLDRVSNTVQWVEGSEAEKRKEYTKQHIQITTKALEGEQNSLIDCSIQFSNPTYEADLKQYKEDGSRKSSSIATDGKITPSKWVNCEETTITACHMPQKNSIVALGGESGKISIFCLNNHPSTPTDIYTHPDSTLDHHQQQCNSLDWSILNQGLLVSSSNDTEVCLWDLQGSIASQYTIPLRVYCEQKDHVNTVCWHPIENNILTAGSEDGTMYFYDKRQAHSTNILQAHTQSLNVIAFNPVERFLFATASNDHTISLWDYRSLGRPIHSLIGHYNHVTSLQWSPFSTCILASGSDDCRVNLWDISKIGTDLSTEQRQEGPAELIFVHGGHTAKVNAISWNPNDPWTLASVADDSSLHLWHIANSIINQTCCAT